MSKAFVKDDGGDEDDPLESEEASESVARGSAYITAEGFRALQEELQHLWKVERPKVTHEVAVAAAQGDRSENAEYIYGKKRLREIDRRIRFLTKRIDALTIVTHDKQQEGRVFFGAWVTVEDEEGTPSTYRLVGSDEIDLAKNVISVESPLARALLGKRVGDVVTVQRPKGPADYTVAKITYRP
jgi:transcription elongation factor GreB